MENYINRLFQDFNNFVETELKEYSVFAHKTYESTLKGKFKKDGFIELGVINKPISDIYLSQLNQEEISRIQSKIISFASKFNLSQIESNSKNIFILNFKKNK